MEPSSNNLDVGGNVQPGSDNRAFVAVRDSDVVFGQSCCGGGPSVTSRGRGRWCLSHLIDHEFEVYRLSFNRNINTHRARC